jgi:glutathione-regulated potassium-efflux system ancillary protein KefG
MSKVLLIFAHPNLESSRVNAALLKKLPVSENFVFYDIYRKNKNYKFDVASEQELLIKHEQVVFQFPFHWYSATPLLRLWFDEVLTHGFAYGSEGKALHGKKFSCVITTGGPAEAYQRSGYNYYTIEELLMPLRQTANLIGMIWQEPFLVQGALSIAQEELDKKSFEYRDYIQKKLG